MKSEIRVKEYDIKSYERNLKKLEDESSLNVFIGNLIRYHHIDKTVDIILSVDISDQILKNQYNLYVKSNYPLVIFKY